MKKFNLLFWGLIANFAFAQCNIEGIAQLSANETSTYSIGNELAQCKQYHQWSVIGNASIIGDNRQNSVIVKGLSSGNVTLNLQYFSPQGLVKCSKDIAILGVNTPKTEKAQDQSCDISLTNFKEVKMSNESLILYPDTQQELSYSWEAIYKNGNKETSNEKVPQFTLDYTNPITQIHVKVFSKSCYKQFSKTYDTGFWKVLK